jgi:hypothetical protein
MLLVTTVKELKNMSAPYCYNMAYTRNKRYSFGPDASDSNVIWYELDCRDSIRSMEIGTRLDHPRPT